MIEGYPVLYARSPYFSFTICLFPLFPSPIYRFNLFCLYYRSTYQDLPYTSRLPVIFPLCYASKRSMYHIIYIYSSMSIYPIPLYLSIYPATILGFCLLGLFYLAGAA